MNTPWLTFLLALSIGASAWAAGQSSNSLTPPLAAAPMPAANQSQPRIHFASVIHDFGKMVSGELAKCEFVFTNEGSRLLELTAVIPACDCIFAGQWTRQVEPGKTGRIPVQLKTAHFNGSVTKSVTITCNDPVQPRITLLLKANFWRPIDVSPSFVILKLTPESPSNAAMVRIVNNLEQPLTLSEPESKNPAFAAEIETVRPGKEYQLMIKTVAPFPQGNVQSQISVATSSTNMPVINVSTWANMQQTVIATPAQIILPVPGLQNDLIRTIAIRNTGSNAITLSDPVVTGMQGVEVVMKDFQPGRYFGLSITFPPGLKLSQADKPELRVKTSHPQYPVIRVPIIQQPPFGSKLDK